MTTVKEPRTREELQFNMDDAARNYAKTHDLKYRAEFCEAKDRLEERQRVEGSIAILEHARARCRTEDIRIAEVYGALNFLAGRGKEKWPFERFRKALDEGGTEGSQAERRWQVLNASLNAIKLALR